MGRRVVPVADLIREALRRFGRPAPDRGRLSRMSGSSGKRSTLPTSRRPCSSRRAMGGLKDSPGRVRDFRRSVKGGKVWAKPRLLIRQSLANARTVSDSMGEERLIKGGVSGRRRTARDDVAVSIVAAVSEGARMPAQAPRRRRHAVA